MRRPVHARAQHHIGQAFAHGGCPRQSDFLVGKAQPLRHAKARCLGPGGGVEQPGGGTQRQQVVIGDAVLASKGVLGVDGGKVEVVGGRVIHRQQALVTVGRVGVEGARLQRLQKGAAEILRIALEKQAAVEADGGQHAVERTRAVGQHAVELVVAGMQLHARRDEALRRQKRPADLRQRIAARSVGLAGAAAVGLEACRIQLHAGIEATAQPGGHIAHLPLRQSVEGRDDGRCHVLLGLPLQGAHAHRQVALGPGQLGIARQQTLGKLRLLLRVPSGKIAPIVVVAHPVDVEVHAHPPQGRGDHATVLQAIAPARALAQAVAGQNIRTHLALVGGLQVTEFTPQLQAALGHGGGLQRGVAVGRDVPVVGLRVLKAVDAVQTHGGRK